MAMFPGFGFNMESSSNPMADQINSILQSYLPQVNKFFTNPSSIMAMLQGNQARAVGQAGAQGGAYAASKGYDPFAYIQRAQAPVQNEYANQAYKIPEIMSNINQGNFGMLARMLGLLTQNAGSARQDNRFGMNVASSNTGG